ncbi:MAG: hypothetical protein AB7V18_13300 [Pyrinomonadaceae bacterium]
MFLGIKKFSNVKDPEMVMKKIESELVPKMRKYPGFIAYYAVKFDDGDQGGVGIFETKANVDNALAQTRDWQSQNLKDHVTSEPQILRGEVVSTAADKTIARSA